MTKIQRDKGKTHTHTHTRRKKGFICQADGLFSFEWKSYQNMMMKRRRAGEGERRWGVEAAGREDGIGGLMERHSAPNDSGEQTMRG